MDMNVKDIKYRNIFLYVIELCEKCNCYCFMRIYGFNILCYLAFFINFRIF